MAEKLNCGEAEYQARYLEHYRRVFNTLKQGLPELGEGKDGFAPPF